jgi:hypothetical protein
MMVAHISNWFSLDDQFERDKLMVRNDSGAPLRTIYLVNETVKVIRLF